MRGLRTLTLLILPISAALTLAGAGRASAAESATATVTVTASFSSKTSLQVSRDVLRFDVVDADREATAVVEFTAGARTHQGGDVVLTVEPARAIEGPGGAADVETQVRFAGDGTGTRSGVLSPGGPVIAGRWNGSGRRAGQLVFGLRAGAPGSYSVPLRFVLSAP